MILNKTKVLNIYKVTDITKDYANYSEEEKRRYRSVFVDDMILHEPMYKVVCKIERNNKTEIITKIWSKSELELIKKNQYYLS